MKVKPFIKSANSYGYVEPDFIFFCPGCKCDHGVWTTQRNRLNAIWSFNGNLERPTFSPSLLITLEYGEDGRKEICHSFIRDGQIQFLSDCTHDLKGKTVAIPDYND
jgi:hypothetical protein